MCASEDEYINFSDGEQYSDSYTSIAGFMNVQAGKSFAAGARF